MKKGVLRNFIKFTAKHLFSCEFCKIFKNTFFTELLWTTASAENIRKPLVFLMFSGVIERAQWHEMA